MKWVLIGILFFLAISCQAQTTTRIFIVRHADRQEADDLNSAGSARAIELKRVLLDTGIDSIFSTDFVRTKKTVTPLAEALSLPVLVYDSNPPLVKRLIKNNTGKTILVAGHSNTVLPLIAALGCSSKTTVITSGQFDDLFLVILEHGATGVTSNNSCCLLHMKYGATTP